MTHQEFILNWLIRSQPNTPEDVERRIQLAKAAWGVCIKMGVVNPGATEHPKVARTPLTTAPVEQLPMVLPGNGGPPAPAPVAQESREVTRSNLLAEIKRMEWMRDSAVGDAQRNAMQITVDKLRKRLDELG